MTSSLGEIVRMDENGATKFPSDKLATVVNNVRLLQRETRMNALQKARSAAEIRAIFRGEAYGDEANRS